MSDTAWTQVAQMVLGVVGLITLWLKIRSAKQSVETKIDAKSEAIQTSVDDNTKLTKQGTAAATLHASEAKVAATDAAVAASDAAVAASGAKVAAQEVSKKLNGGLDHAIATALAPIREEMKSFVTNDKMEEFMKYVHQRNHNLLDAMQAQTSKMALLLQRLDKK